MTISLKQIQKEYNVSERALDLKEEIFLCLIDWQEALDLVNWTKLLESL
jgi:hypothetical protein